MADKPMNNMAGVSGAINMASIFLIILKGYNAYISVFDGAETAGCVCQARLNCHLSL